jgi:hypothetical protein
VNLERIGEVKEIVDEFKKVLDTVDKEILDTVNVERIGEVKEILDAVSKEGLDQARFLVYFSSLLAKC